MVLPYWENSSADLNQGKNLGEIQKNVWSYWNCLVIYDSVFFFHWVWKLIVYLSSRAGVFLLEYDTDHLGIFFKMQVLIQEIQDGAWDSAYRTSAKSCSWYWSMDQILVARAEGRCNLGSTEESHGLLELYDDVQSLYVCGCARSVFSKERNYKSFITFSRSMWPTSLKSWLVFPWYVSYKC